MYRSNWTGFVGNTNGEGNLSFILLPDRTYFKWKKLHFLSVARVKRRQFVPSWRQYRRQRSPRPDVCVLPTFLGFRSGSLSADLSRGFVRGDGGAVGPCRLTARYPAGRQTTTITGYFRRDRSHVCFEGYLVDDGAPTRHDCDVNY